MIIPDLNVLIYAYDSLSPYHERAKGWWERCLSGDETVGLTPVVIFGFVRLTTNPRVFLNPRSLSEVTERVRSWLEQPVVRVLEPGKEHVETTLDLLNEVGAGGNLVTDCQLVAYAKEHGGMIHTNDSDFARFNDVQWHNPITHGSGPRENE